MTTPLSHRYLGNDAAEYESRRYQGWVRRANLQALERALGRAMANIPAGALVLDLPCGTGILRPFLLARGYRVVSADLSPDMLAIARRRPAGLGHVRADYAAAPFRRESFDAVVCVRFFNLLSERERPRALRLLAELSRGPLVVTVNHPYTIKGALRRLRVWLRLSRPKKPRPSRAQIEREAADAGLRIQQIHQVTPLLSEVWVVVFDAAPRRTARADGLGTAD
jgi:SAM-dependent methyltransferase